MTLADVALLAQLLAERLPRGQRCGTCYSFDPAEDDQEWGGCKGPHMCLNVHVRDACPQWEPRDCLAFWW